jgi:hypothetical protein
MSKICEDCGGVKVILTPERRISASLTSNQERTSTFGAGRASFVTAFQAV